MGPSLETEVKEGERQGGEPLGTLGSFLAMEREHMEREHEKGLWDSCPPPGKGEGQGEGPFGPLRSFFGRERERKGEETGHGPLGPPEVFLGKGWALGPPLPFPSQVATSWLVARL